MQWNPDANPKPMADMMSAISIGCHNPPDTVSYSLSILVLKYRNRGKQLFLELQTYDSPDSILF